MAKYRKKPVVIEALEFTGDNKTVIRNWSNGEIESGQGRTLLIKTLEGVMLAKAGDFIIKGVEGEFYPRKPDIFDATYELVG